MTAYPDIFPDPQSTPADPAGEPRISYVVARLERAIRRAINERVSLYDLTVLQYTTLSVLGRRGELSNAQLARRAYMSPQAMSEVIEALESKGLIKRSQHPNHRRVYPGHAHGEGQAASSRPASASSTRWRRRCSTGSRRERASDAAQQSHPCGSRPPRGVPRDIALASRLIVK